MITVIGLGVNEGDLTLKGKEAIVSAARVLVRTANTRSYGGVRLLGVAHETLDFVYEKSRSFSTLHKNLAKAVRAAEKESGNVAYCVDGAAIEDNSVKELLKRGAKNVRVISGVSKVSALVEKAGFAGCSYTAVSAYEAEEKKKNGGLVAPLVVYDIDDKTLAGDIKLLLSEQFGEETEVKLLQGDKAKKIKLYELDRGKTYDYTTAVAVDEQALLEKKRFTLSDLERVLVRLRRPDGCPWDRVQTPESIKMNAVEEAYELLDAIDSGDPDKILEETGDMLMQVVFHAVMQEERGEFSLGDVVTGVCDKLIFRHTHIFGGDTATDEQSALSVWDKNKMKEKNQNTFSDAVNDVPKCFPALMQAQKIAKRLEKGGWTQDVSALRQRIALALKTLEIAGSDTEKKEALGTLLMSAVWLSRAVGVEGEEALLETVKRLKEGYTLYERTVLADGKDVNALSEEERAAYYERVKGELS